MTLECASLDELAKRCGAADGPDRGLDRDIFVALGMPLPDKFLGKNISLMWDAKQSSFVMPLYGMQVRFDHPHYTGSFDVASSLMIVDWSYVVASRSKRTGQAYCSLSRRNGRFPDAPHLSVDLIDAYAATPTLALLSCILRVRAMSIDTETPS